MQLQKEELVKLVDNEWESSIIPELTEYIKIPNISPAFDKDWQKNGHIEKVVNMAADWCLKQDIKGMKLSIERIPDRTPLIFIEIEATDNNSSRTALLYGHLDKQPEMTGWDDDKGPWKPVLIGEKLYGRGAADDGYALFTALTAIKLLQMQNIPHPRCVVLAESCEEGGSHDLPYYIENLSDRIGHPELVICLDSGCGNYDQLWLTTSLRGAVLGNLKVELLKEGIHSGNGGGVIASSFRVIRSLLDRLEDSTTGKIHLSELEIAIPEDRKDQARKTAEILDNEIGSFPLFEGVEIMPDNNYELILNRTWRPSLSYIGADGLPKAEVAGNVLRPSTTLKLSMRIPPTANSFEVAAEIKALLEKNPPYNAKVSFTVIDRTDGWNAPSESVWFAEAIEEASNEYYGKEPVYMGEGGSIPFMNLLSKKFPQAQFLITGVLGPLSNAHGPNEFLHLPSAKKINCCVAHVLAKFAN